MTDHPIPDAALDDRLGFVGTSGSGKTYATGTCVETLLRRKSRVGIIDPLGVWWGLRSLADGKRPSPFDVVIFGGPRGDLALTENAGALIGESVAAMKESFIIDLRDLGTKGAERRFMNGFLKAIYAKARGEPLHLVIDEADMFAPQKIDDKEGNAVALLGMMETVVRRGRVRGFIPWLITQRPAVLNKNVLSQVDGLVAMKLTSSQDRKALWAWIEGQADTDRGREMLSQLPALEIGRGIVWLPGHGILTEKQFPKKLTFDSSRAPRRGEKVRAAKLRPLDVESVRARLASIETEVKANDPRVLNARIAELEKQIAKAPKTGADPGAVDHARKSGFLEGRATGAREGFGDAIKIFEGVRRKASVARSNLDTLIDELDGAITKPPPALPAGIKAVGPMTVTRENAMKSVGAPITPQKNAGRFYRENMKSAALNMSITDPTLPAGERAVLTALVQHPGGMSREHISILSGYKKSTRDLYIRLLRVKGLISGNDELVATEAGVAALGDFDPLPTGAALREHWLARLPEGERRILAELCDHHPNPIGRDTIGDRCGYKKSTRDLYIRFLKTRRLVVDNGAGLNAAPQLFDGEGR